jgi:alanine transaminase
MAPSLAPGTLNPAILNVQYAVRGELAIKAEEYREKIKANPKDHGLPFSKVTTANIGNPQQAGLDQKPLTFGRQVYPSHLIFDRCMLFDVVP